MKAKYRIWHLPLLSFYSRRLYRDVSSHWKGTNLGYLCLLLAICLIPAVRNGARRAEAIIDAKADIFLMQIPPMQFTNGRLVVDAPQPYSIIEGNSTVLLIDTTGEISAPEDAGALALLTGTQLQLKQKGQPPVVYELSDFGDMEMSQAVASTIVERTKQFFVPVFYGLAYVVSLVLFVMAALLCAVVALIFGAMMNKDLNFASGLRLSAVALTPPAILGGGLELANRSIPFFLYLLLALAYLYRVVGAARKKRPNEPCIDNDPVGH
jgi:hypothetical protein